MRKIPLRPFTGAAKIEETTIECLKKCTSIRSLKQVHAHITTTGLHQENYLSVKLVFLCGKELGDIAYARRIFDASMDTANVFLWTAMITAYSKHELPVTMEAILMYRKMHIHSIEANAFTLSSVLKACSILVAVQEGRQLHVHAVKLCLDSNMYVKTTLLDMYAKFGCIEAVTELYDTMPERNIVACNAMIACYGKAGNVKGARNVFDMMEEKDSISWSTMISGYTNHGNMQVARELFNLLTVRDVRTWNALKPLICGYAQFGEWHKALELFKEMQLEHVKPNQVTMAAIISVCGHVGALEIARQMHKYLKNSNDIEMNAYVFNSLIDMYAKCGHIAEAHQVFCDMSCKDIVSYNTMIVGLANFGCGKDALQVFSKLLVSGLQPDAITFLGVLTACSHGGLLNAGRQYFCCMKRDYQIDPSVDHYACMVDLFGRAGLVEEAYGLIKTMAVEPHAGVWGALLGACITYGNIEVGEIAAEKLFKIEPKNPGNYVLLSNIYAKANMWGKVLKVRHLMREKGVSKTVGCSWIEVDYHVHQFLIGDTSHAQFKHICMILKLLSLQWIFDARSDLSLSQQEF